MGKKRSGIIWQQIGLFSLCIFLMFAGYGFAQDLPLPRDAAGAWDINKAWKASSPTRGKICLNGLWKFFPGGGELPARNSGWGWFKVPGIWPKSSYAEAGRQPQQVLLAPSVAKRGGSFGNMGQAWYKREFAVPKSWAGRRILVEFTMVQTNARVFINGNDAGQVPFPGGLLDVTDRINPGNKQTLAILVTSNPRLRMRGLTGDVFILGEPMQDAVGNVHVITSTRKKTITLDTEIRNPSAGKRILSARVFEGGKVVKEFKSDVFGTETLKNGRISFSAQWTDPKLWDTDTPENMYEVVISLSNERGKPLDVSLPVRFGFREFWAEGKDLYLNGSIIHIRALCTENIQRPADRASLEGCLLTGKRMKEAGFNFFVPHNYDFKPGSVGYIDSTFEAADQVGMLAVCTLPHGRDHGWLKTPEQVKQYRALTDWLIRRVQNHPSLVMYSMNHNANGYFGDQNPLKIDGIYNPDKLAGGWLNDNRKQSVEAYKIAKKIDPTRLIYHHQSGNLGDVYSINIYLNWSPQQERSDWLEHWATKGVVPLFFVEWGPPHLASWGSYRGPGVWRLKTSPQLWKNEFAAAYQGDEAYRMTEKKINALKNEESLWASGEPFSFAQNARYVRDPQEKKIKAHMLSDNWRAHRTWGISATLPWDQEAIWDRTARTSPMPVRDKYKNIQRPGIFPDIITPADYIDDLKAENFEWSPMGKVFERWNKPVIGYIGGKPEHFTEKGHNFTSGERVEKQLVILNDTRRDADCSYSWRVEKLDGIEGNGNVTVKPGEKALVPISIAIPEDIKPGSYTVSAKFDFGKNGTQEDTFKLNIMPRQEKLTLNSKVALYDPRGMTAKLLEKLGVEFESVEADAGLKGFDILVIGREALSVDTNIPGVSLVPKGLKVLVFEQSADVLTKKLGFRINIYGLRQVFVRSIGHPALAGLAEENLKNWRGEATIVPPYLTVPEIERTDPKWNWCGFQNTRVWRCRNRGNIATVLIEKPPRGNFLPIVDGGFDLQFSPLLEYTEGKGKIIFCQLDVTGRTIADPAARKVCANLLTYLDAPHPSAARKTLYAGEEQGAELLRQLGVSFKKFGGQPLDKNTLLVVGPGAAGLKSLIASLENGLNLLCLGLEGGEIDKLLPGEVKVSRSSAVPTLAKWTGDAALAGVSNAELRWRTILEYSALQEPPEGSNEALRAISKGEGKAVFCQATPWMFDYRKKGYIRTTYRRNTFLVSRLLNNLGAGARSPVVSMLSGKGASDIQLTDKWKGMVDKENAGNGEEWFKPGFNDKAWQAIKVPGAFDEQVKGLEDYDGAFWYRIRFKAPEELKNEPALMLKLGPIDDESWVWLNGRFLGEVTKATNPKDYWKFPREYQITPDMLNFDDENTLAVRVNDTYQKGGIFGEPFIATQSKVLSHYMQKPKAVDDPYRYYRW